MGLFDSYRAGKRRAALADRLYNTVVAQSRQPMFYTDWGVPDTVDGRYDAIILHMMLLFRRLRGNAEATALAQALMNAMFTDMDRNLREMGVGDLSVGKQVKKIAKAFYGRAEGYERAMEEGPDALRTELVNTIYRRNEPDARKATELTDYVYAVDRSLAQQSLDDLMTGQVTFPLPLAAVSAAG